MTTETSEPRGSPHMKGDRPLYEATRRLLLASVGAVALAQDEIEDFINKLVERGELADKEGFKLMNEMKSHRSKHLRKAEEELTGHLEAAMTRMNLPTKADLDALSEKISTLNQRIEELKKE
ncbi:MAG TPA: hypothetical protein VN363_00805 [Anaerolineales bacterium]|nr:hypothetical protein [Anaerolineales bacterium]